MSMTSFLMLLLTCLILEAQATTKARKPQNNYTWYRGNTHTHTILSGHGDAKPEAVVEWYHTRGYNFLVLSEHNRFIDPEKVQMPVPLRQDFILIPGIELTGKKNIHTTALNVKVALPANFDSKNVYQIVQNHVDQILGAGGRPIINHPNWIFALTGDDLLKVKNLEMMELYNGHPEVHNHGDESHESTEKIWDKLLRHGKKMYAVAADDAHYFHTIKDDLTNPGRGWIMVKAADLNPEEILKSLSEGHFYASNGVMLEDIVIDDGEITISVDLQKTGELIASEAPRGDVVNEQKETVTIEFIGPNLKVEKKVTEKMKATFSLTKMSGDFIRAKVNVIKKVNNKMRHFSAWTQPIFKSDL